MTWRIFENDSLRTQTSLEFNLTRRTTTLAYKKEKVSCSLRKRKAPPDDFDADRSSRTLLYSPNTPQTNVFPPGYVDQAQAAIVGTRIGDGYMV